ncbi:aminotransferase class I/II-fold pyridoxal phosphate-dependent enzyme [Spirochaeta isovalerica]|uniref:Aspartate aminotransferase n=1 Tax=Spirochaeta isovalerica TaxID=150 RepID=A0A841RCH3_9SPIO|nr:aminotransferase class I/II-fold pyridoxal phosphate-dependent enzyme [Spirochaeta isovalerica]MBB6480368.1 aspartate aminotransferase [Spirochaeta isovalerica]
MKPQMSRHFSNRKPSAIRLAQIKFAERKDNTKPVNTAIGNVSLPLHPAISERMFNLNKEDSPFKEGVVKYTATVGMEETNQAFLNIIASSGFSTEGLYSQVTNGGSQAMEMVILGVCGDAGSTDHPLLLIDAAYTNYNAMAARVGRRTVSVSRTLGEDGNFSLPSMEEIETVIEKEKPSAMVVIPYDNPTGQFYSLEAMKTLAEICVKHNIWMISDEAYRELFYTKDVTSSIWGVTDKDVPGIEGRRISIETSSKVWNGCGLRIGALVTDRKDFHEKSVAECTADLCSNAIGQYMFGALAHESHDALGKWYESQRNYYSKMLVSLTEEFKELVPGIIVSNPDASLYSVIDVRNVVDENFNAQDFVLFCAREGKVDIKGEELTLLVAPMAGFYSLPEGAPNPGRTQMRIAYVEKPERMALVPALFASLLEQYKQR